MLTPIKNICEDICNEIGITPIKKEIKLNELPKLREMLELNNDNQGNLICIGSRPAVGKTLVVSDIVLDTASYSSKDIFVFHSEETSKHIVHKYIQKLSGVNIHNLQDAELTEIDKNKLSNAIAFLQDMNIWLDDADLITPSYIEGALKETENIGLVVVDCISLVGADYISLVETDEKRISRQQEISEISKKLLILSKKYNIPIIVLTQIGEQVPEHKHPNSVDIDLWDIVSHTADIEASINKNQDSDSKDVSILVVKNYGMRYEFINMQFDEETISFKEST